MAVRLLLHAALEDKRERAQQSDGGEPCPAEVFADTFEDHVLLEEFVAALEKREARQELVVAH